MPLSLERKAGVIDSYRSHGTDTGSTEVQVALLSTRIQELQQHFAMHKQDHHSRQGLLKMVGRRRRLLRYLKNQDLDRYRKLISRLGLRK
ncbi:MAG: 30S ribosomal protein S15 [Acidobacteriota bacterium]